MPSEPARKAPVTQVQTADDRTRRGRWQRPNCPRCDGVVLVAERSRFNLEGRIDHIWHCDDCGHEFATSISLSRQRHV